MQLELDPAHVSRVFAASLFEIFDGHLGDRRLMILGQLVVHEERIAAGRSVKVVAHVGEADLGKLIDDALDRHPSPLSASGQEFGNARPNPFISIQSGSIAVILGIPGRYICSASARAGGYL